MELKKALPSRHLLLAFGDRGPRVGGEKAPSVNAISAAETAEADACIMTANCPRECRLSSDKGGTPEFFLIRVSCLR